jgi:hypothetical protein
MPLGAVFIRPQPLLLPPSRQGEDPLEIILTFLESFTTDPTAALPALSIMAEVSSNGLRDFVLSQEERIRFADGKIRNLFRPYGDFIDAFIDGLGESPLETIPAVLEALVKLLDHLTSDKVKEFVQKLFDLIEHDLGISGETVRNLFNDLTSQMITRMKSRVVGGDTSDEATALYEFGSGLQELQSLVNDPNIPGIDVNLLLTAIEKHWKDSGLDLVISVVKEVLKHSEDIIEPLTKIAEAVINLNVHVEVNVSGNSPSLGAAAADPVAKEAEGPEGTTAAGTPESGDNPVAWYASWVAGRIVNYPTDTNAPINLFNNPQLIGFSYKHVTAEKMEKLAHTTAWLVPTLESFLHTISVEQGDVLTNLVNMGFDGIDTVLVAGFRKPSLLSGVDLVQPGLLRFFSFMGYNALTGLEGGRFSNVGNDPYVYTCLGGDIGEAILYRRWIWVLREAFLSFITLLNNDPEEFETWVAERRQAARTDGERLEIENAIKNHNNNCFEGVCYFFGEFGAMLLPIILSRTDRANYGFVGGGPRPEMFGKAIGGAAISWAFMYLAILVARIPAGQFPTDWVRYGILPFKDRIYGKYEFDNPFNAPSAVEGVARFFKIPWAAIRGAVALMMYIVDHGMYLYLFTDGSTDGGEFCIDDNGVERRFMGYPEDYEQSPYRLPWAKDTMLQCVQGNMGIWSHHVKSVPTPPATNVFINLQTYAYDFSHGGGTDVLCARSGIVTQITDTQPDNNPKNWNFVEIMHLIVFPPGSDQGVAGVPAPAGITQFADSVTNIPADALFPPYWDAAGNTLWPLPNPMPLHPSAAILPSGVSLSAPATPGGPDPRDYYGDFAGFPVDSRFAFIDPSFDRAIAGLTLPAGGVFSDGTPIPPDVVFAPDVAVPPPPGSSFPAGTTFVPPVPGGATTFQPLLATFGIYGHGLFGFMKISIAPPSPGGTGFTTDPRPSGPLTDVFRSRTNNEVLGLFVQQGQPCLLSGDTGVSAYYHLHTHVLCQTNGQLTIPFVYRDASHSIVHGFREVISRRNGVPFAMTFYTSGNARIDPS